MYCRYTAPSRQQVAPTFCPDAGWVGLAGPTPAEMKACGVCGGKGCLSLSCCLRLAGGAVRLCYKGMRTGSPGKGQGSRTEWPGNYCRGRLLVFLLFCRPLHCFAFNAPTNAEIVGNTGISCFIMLHCIVLHRCCIFCKLKARHPPALPPSNHHHQQKDYDALLRWPGTESPVSRRYVCN